MVVDLATKNADTQRHINGSKKGRNKIYRRVYFNWSCEYSFILACDFIAA